MTRQIDDAILSVASIPEGPDADKHFACVVAAARELGPARITDLVKRMTRAPKITAKKAGVPQFRDGWGRMWGKAILDILCELGEGAVQPLLSLMEPFRPIPFCYHEALAAALLRLAATTAARGEILSCLRRVLPQLHHTVVRSVVVHEIGLRKARFPESWTVLTEIADLVIIPAATKDRQSQAASKFLISLGHDKPDDEAGSPPTTIRNFMEDCLHEDRVAAEYAARRSPEAVPAEIEGPWKEFAKRFAEAVASRDFASARSLFTDELCEKYTNKGLEMLVKEWTRHSGWPDDFEIAGNDTTLAEIREFADSSFGPVPETLTEVSFRKWVSVKFLPEQGSDMDACFDWWMALIERSDAMKIGYFEVLDPD